MANYSKEAKDIKCVVIKTITEEIDSRGGKHALRLVDWQIDGKLTGVKLERRDFWTSENGEEKMGKAKGLSLNDLTKVYAVWDEIRALMSGQRVPKKADEDGFPG